MTTFLIYRTDPTISSIDRSHINRPIAFQSPRSGSTDRPSISSIGIDDRLSISSIYRSPDQLSISSIGIDDRLSISSIYRSPDQLSISSIGIDDRLSISSIYRSPDQLSISSIGIDDRLSISSISSIYRSAIYLLNRNRRSLINLLDRGSRFFNSRLFFPIVSNEMRWAIGRVVCVPMDSNRSTFETFLLDQTRLHIEGRKDRRRLSHNQSTN